VLAIAYSALLFTLWLLLSGHYDPLLLGLGLTSVALTVFLMKRMNLLDHEALPSHLFSRLPVFFVYIFREIVKSNMDVLKRIMTFSGKSISPQLIEIELPQKTNLGRVIYANSITLTPGTVSVEMTRDKLMVHTLTREAARELSTGDMAKAIPDRLNGK